VAHQTVQFFPSEERTDATNKRVANRICFQFPTTSSGPCDRTWRPPSYPPTEFFMRRMRSCSTPTFLTTVTLLVVVLAEGKTVEAGIVGKEGLVGLSRACRAQPESAARGSTNQPGWAAIVASTLREMLASRHNFAAT